MKQFMEQIPDALVEAAKIDGASEYRIYWQIVMPNVKPAWLTLMILQFPMLWGSDGGNFIYSENLKTLHYALGQIIAWGHCPGWRRGGRCAHPDGRSDHALHHIAEQRHPDDGNFRDERVEGSRSMMWVQKKIFVLIALCCSVGISAGGTMVQAADGAESYNYSYWGLTL